MGKYVLEEYVFNGYNASSKAREDVSNIVLEMGFKSFAKNDKRGLRNNKFNKVVSAGRIYIKMLYKLRKNDLIFLQSSMTVLKGIINIKKVKQFKIVYLIHDMFSIRYDDMELHKSEISKDINMLNKCDYIICHNEEMKKKLKMMGCTKKLFVLKVFDYLIANSNQVVNRTDTHGIIAFAGNLAKSPFLSELDINSRCRYAIYGNPPQQFVHMEYEGSVDASQLPYAIKGNYGLIWEGEYQITEKDNYTRFNNPHKISLYIAAEMPVIIWKKSALRAFVEHEGIGLCIENLNELDEVVASIDGATYVNMVDNCKRIRNKVINGEFLKEVLNKIMKVEGDL